MLAYPARLTPGSEGRVMLTLPDVPELVIVADTEDEAFRKAPPLLDTILSGYEEEGRPIPWPSDLCGAPRVESHRYENIPTPPNSRGIRADLPRLEPERCTDVRRSGSSLRGRYGNDPPALWPQAEHLSRFSPRSIGSGMEKARCSSTAVTIR